MHFVYSFNYSNALERWNSLLASIGVLVVLPGHWSIPILPIKIRWFHVYYRVYTSAMNTLDYTQMILGENNNSELT